ncbi:thylakoid-associated phosphatase 38 [Prunus dulcis]|uniref:protein-serine/threonine phosphatase n=1 Tax=Prunus dulcis TaxID=3755 RepID=A0A4Y1R2Q7_PRUDU|nr:thylakoid-associated phosphatase 38 [Prunus dulcis]
MGNFPNAKRWQRPASVAAKEIGTKEKTPIDCRLTKKDDMLRYKMERVPFLEEQVRKVKDGGQLLGMDIERLLLSEDNRFDFVNDIAAEASEYVENNRDEYGGKKKAILQVISNRCKGLVVRIVKSRGVFVKKENNNSNRFLLTKYHGDSLKTTANKSSLVNIKARSRSCSAIAIDAPGSSLTDVAGIRWGSTSLQGAREEMEDGVVVRSDGLDGFSFAAVFDGHAGFNSVKFLRDELYKECCAALQGGLLLRGNDFKTIREALQETFEKVDAKLLERNGEEDESGSTATVMFVENDTLVISHVGDSCVVQSCSGKAEVLTHPHRPYGSNKVSLQEIKRIREAGGWIVNGRICGDIAVSRAFGDMRFKTKKNEFSLLTFCSSLLKIGQPEYAYIDGLLHFVMERMLKKGVEERRWTEKFASRIQFSGDLVTASPDIFQVTFGKDSEFVLSDAVAFVRNQLRQHGDVQLACDALAQAALVTNYITGQTGKVCHFNNKISHMNWGKLLLQLGLCRLEFGCRLLCFRHESDSEASSARQFIQLTSW